MCQFSEPELDNSTTTHQLRTTKATRNSHPSTHSPPCISTDHTTPPPASPQEPSPLPSASRPCTCIYKCNQHFTTLTTSITTALPAMTVHLTSLHTIQKHTHHLVRKCTQARLYPNPASLSTSKAALTADLKDLTSRMHDAGGEHVVYMLALGDWVGAVRAAMDDLTDRDGDWEGGCRCPSSLHSEQHRLGSAREEMKSQAEQLLFELEELLQKFEKMEIEVLRKWEEGGRWTLEGVVGRLLGPKELKGSVLVKRFFPRQVRELERGARKVVFAPSQDVGGKRVGGNTEGRCDSGLE